MTEQNPQALPKRMETIAAYIFQNENLLREALMMYREEKTQHCQGEGAAQLANTGKFSDLYITHDGYLSANSTSDLYIDWGSHCVYCGNNYVNRIKNINCHLHVKLVEDPSKIWIDLYNHLIPIVEAYHNNGIPAEPSMKKLPVRRESPAASLLYDKVTLGNMIRWFRRSEKGSPEGKERRTINNSLFAQGVKIDNYGSVLDIEDADVEMECTVCGAARSSRGASVECCTADKLASSTHPAWIKAHNALLNIAEPYHAWIKAAAPTQNTPKRRPSVAAYIVQSGEKMKAAMKWWLYQPNGTQLVSAKEYERVDRILDAAKKNLESAVLALPFLSNDQVSKFCAEDEAPEWIEVYNALLNIAEHYHAFTNEQNAAPMGTPTTEKESPNAEAVEASESKTTTTYICGRCDTEHTSLTSAAMCCPDVDVMHTCNECGLHHDTRAAADYCCSSIETKHKHPDDPVLMLYACRTCGTITFDGAINNAQKIAADQHCNPMNEK